MARTTQIALQGTARERIEERQRLTDHLAVVNTHLQKFNATIDGQCNISFETWAGFTEDRRKTILKEVTQWEDEAAAHPQRVYFRGR
jgi:hypothetical protein